MRAKIFSPPIQWQLLFTNSSVKFYSSTVTTATTAAAAGEGKTTTRAIERSKRTFDLAIIGGGIVGAAVARELSTRLPALSIALIEKEDGLGEFSYGLNSSLSFFFYFFLLIPCKSV